MLMVRGRYCDFAACNLDDLASDYAKWLPSDIYGFSQPKHPVMCALRAFLNRKLFGCDQSETHVSYRILSYD